MDFDLYRREYRVKNGGALSVELLLSGFSQRKFLSGLSAKNSA
jgi:hypothetical protein